MCGHIGWKNPDHIAKKAGKNWWRHLLNVDKAHWVTLPYTFIIIIIIITSSSSSSSSYLLVMTCDTDWGRLSRAWEALVDGRDQPVEAGEGTIRPEYRQQRRRDTRDPQRVRGVEFGGAYSRQQDPSARVTGQRRTCLTEQTQSWSRLTGLLRCELRSFWCLCWGNGGMKLDWG